MSIYEVISAKMESGRFLWSLRFIIYLMFFLPLGPAELSPQYALMLKLFQYAALTLVLLYTAYEVKRTACKPNREFIAGALFFAAFIVITLITQGRFNEGLKNLFAWPLLCLYTGLELKRDPRGTLRCIAGILTSILLLDLVISATMYASMYHLRFVGHVQIVFQIAILNLASVLILLRFEEKISPIWVLSIIATLIDCLLTDAASAKVAAILFVLFIVLEPKAVVIKGKHKGESVFSALDSRWVLLLILLVNVGIIYLSVSRSTFLGFSWGLNARNFIWEEVLRLVSASPIIGYGAQGILLEMFWGASGNYAHSQLMQELLDGGLVLTVLFYGMLYLFASKSNKIMDGRTRSIVKCSFACYLVLMIIDSVNLYCYFYIFLPFLVTLNDLNLECGR